MATTTWCFHHEKIIERIPVAVGITLLKIEEGKTKILVSLIKISIEDLMQHSNTFTVTLGGVFKVLSLFRNLITRSYQSDQLCTMLTRTDIP